MNEWREQAVCSQVDSDLWFPEKGEWGKSQQARDVCSRCPVINECLEFALTNGEVNGIWGGTTHEQRKELGYKEREHRKSDWCKRGHSLLNKYNVYVAPSGHRECLTCRRIREADYTGRFDTYV